MNRVAWLVLASCAAAPQHRDPPIAMASGGPPSTTEARVAFDGGVWIDYVLEGTGADANDACGKLVGRLRLGMVNARVVRPCRPGALPVLATATALRIEEDTDEAGAWVARRVTYHAIADVAACERGIRDEQARLQVSVADMERARIAELDHALGVLVIEETEACQRTAKLLAGCEKTAGDERTHCLLDTQPAQIACDEMRRRHARLDLERRTQPKPFRPTQRCVAPSPT